MMELLTKSFKKGVIFIAINDLVRYNIRIAYLFDNSLLIITESFKFIFLKKRVAIYDHHIEI